MYTNADNMQASGTVQHTYLGGSHRADNDRMAANVVLEASLTSLEPWLLTLHLGSPLLLARLVLLDSRWEHFLAARSCCAPFCLSP